MQPVSTVRAKLKRQSHPHWSLLCVACCGFILAACGSQGPPLNSEGIAQTFGSYGVDVIRNDEHGRVASLYSGSGADKVTRTFAVVKFNGRVRPAFAEEHARVQSGQSLGAVFKAAGWEIEKHNIFIGELEVPVKCSLLSDLMHIKLPATLATHVYLFVIRKNERSYSYATITELHHPDYLSVDDLRKSYGEVIFDDSDRTGIDDFIDPEIWRN